MEDALSKARAVVVPLRIGSGSVPALAEACIRVLTDDALCSRLASAGRRTAETSFAWDKIKSRFGAEIRAVLVSAPVA